MAESGKLTVEVVAPDHVLWTGEAASVSIPAAEGDMGLHPGHESVLALLRAGTVRVHADGDTRRFAVQGGFISFDENAVTVVVEDVED